MFKVLRVHRGLLLKKSPKQGSGQSPEVFGFVATPRGLFFYPPLDKTVKKRYNKNIRCKTIDS